MKRWQVILIILVLSTGFNVWFAKRERVITIQLETQLHQLQQPYDHSGSNCNKVYQPKDMT